MSPTSNSQPQNKILEAMPHIVWLAKPTGEITYFNRRWEEYTGLPNSNSLGWHFLEALHPEDRQRVESQWQQALQGTESYEIELRLGCKEGTYHQFIARAEPVEGDAGQISEWVGTFTFAGKLEETEAQLHKEEQFLRALLDNIADGIVACDANGIITLFNPAAENFHGRPAEPIPPQEWADRYNLYLPDGKTPMPLEEIPLYRALQGEAVRDVEMAIALEGETARILKASGNAIVAPSGEKLGAVVVMRDVSDLKQAEKELQWSEERWQLILRGTGDGIFDWNIETGEAFMSERLKEMVGYKNEEMANTYEAWFELLHPEDAKRVEEAIEAHLELKRPYALEYRLRCKDGSYKWIWARGQAKWDEGGQGLRMVGTHQDISDRKFAEAEILRRDRDLERRVARRTAQLEAANRLKDELLAREQAARMEIQLYKDIVENMQMGLCVWHLESGEEPSFSLVTANPAARKLLSKNLEDCQNLLLRECFPQPPEDGEILVEAHAEVIRSQQPKELGEFHYTNAEERSSFFTIKIFPLPNSFVGMAIEDITERKWIEQALLESSQRYRLVVNNIKEIIFQTDINANLSFLNPAWTEITGFTVLESLNHHFVDFMFSPEDKEHFGELFQCLIEEKKEYFHCEFQIQTKKGDLRWLEMKAQVNFNIKGAKIGVCGTIDDVTDRKETEVVFQARALELAQVNSVLLRTTRQLKKRNQELDRFAYVTSHDLKAPLRAIANLSEWIEEDLADVLTEDTRYNMNLLRGRVHRMEALINGLLQYSRVGRIQTEPEMVNVNTLLRELIKYLEFPAEFKVEIEGEMPTFLTERVPLQQVFTNLVSNGIKHHDRQDGLVKISLSDRGSFYEFAVADDGPGIEPKYHEKIFAIFQTLEARDKTENTGIGLSIVKKAVETQGGTITVESELGRGTRFRFTWPK